MATMDVMEKSSNGKRMIDANKIINDIGLYMAENSYLNDTPLDILKMVADWIKCLQTVDAVEVVRCKDCKHRYSDSWCEYVDDDDNFYCARGERKEGAD